MQSGIYIITNRNIQSSSYNWKYIGKSINCENRIKNHFSRKTNSYLNYAIQKYKTNFEINIIQIEEPYLNEFEQFCIAEFKESGYNLYNRTLGGDGGDTYSLKSDKEKQIISQKLSVSGLGRKHSISSKRKMSIKAKGRIISEEHKEQVSKAQLGNKNRLGKTHSTVTRYLISQNRKGKKHSEVSKEKIRIANVGKVLSEEHKQKISIANTGKKHSEETKKKLSENMIGQEAWNKGIPNIHAQGAKWYNNGEICRFSKEPLDFPWVLGRLKFQAGKTLLA